ncbi:MAG: hypothetical protein B7Z15_05190 [Rhizobiales bacterium 32-66-8]|nr:MAG: hypothetical protein B7Z15_05190 [Rhizobiales bacterium 32-66-8]
MTGTDRQIARGVAIACLVGAGFWFAWELSELILLIFAAILVAVALHALSEPVAKLTGLSVRMAMIPTSLVLVIGFGLAMYLFGSLIQEQVAELIQRLPGAWAAFRDRFELQELEQNLMRQAENAVPSGTTVLSFLRGFGSNVANIILGIFLVVVGGIYFAIQPTMYRDGLLALLPEGSRAGAGEKLDRAGIALRRFLKAQLIAMLLVGVVCGAGLAIIGVPSAIALGLFAGLAEFVPLVGPVASAIPALLLALTVGFDTALWTLALFLVVQQIEGNILSPLLQQQIVSVPAAVTLFAVVAFGTVFGPLGILLATPLTVVIFAVFTRSEKAASAGQAAPPAAS